MAPTSENIFHPEKYFPMPERIGWVRKHCIEEFYSDEELHPEIQEKQTLDRLKVSRAFYTFSFLLAVLYSPVLLLCNKDLVYGVSNFSYAGNPRPQHESHIVKCRASVF
jgi:hypothetical protein